MIGRRSAAMSSKQLYTICLHDTPTLMMLKDVASMQLPMPNRPLDIKQRETIRGARAYLESLPDGVLSGIAAEVAKDEISDALDTWLGMQLTGITTADGKSLWNGEPESVEIREATSEEAERWHAARDDLEDEEDRPFFLVPVRDEPDDLGEEDAL
jgi:hypothetical protein